MGAPDDSLNPRGAAPDDELYRVSQPSEAPPIPDFVARHMQAAEARRPSAAEEPPPPPRWPMLSGVFTFPWYPSTLAYWIFISVGMIVTGLLVMLLWSTGMKMGLLGPRLFGPPAAAAGILAFSYAFACCLAIIEGTAHGWDAIDEWPEGNWKEWVWSFGHVTALLLQAGLVGLVVRLATLSQSWLPFVLGTFAAFPIVLLGALAAGGAWVPLAGLTVLRSIPRLGRQWGMFYLATGAMAAGWWLLTVAGLRAGPWLVPCYSGPVLAAVMLIYARLIGRLASCIDEAMESSSEDE